MKITKVSCKTSAIHLYLASCDTPSYDFLGNSGSKACLTSEVVGNTPCMAASKPVSLRCVRLERAS